MLLVINSVDIKVIVVIIVIVGFILSISIVLFSIVIDVVRFISHSILVLPSNTCVSHYPNKGYDGIDKIVDKTTTGKTVHNIPSKGKKASYYKRAYKSCKTTVIP